MLLLALSARTGVAALSPLAGDIDLDVALDGFALGLLGMIPPIAYGFAGWLTRPVVTRFGLEQLAVIVGLVAVAGHLLRGLAPSYVGLFLVTSLLMVAVGVTNVLLPALVKLYAPGRIGPVTSLYSLLMAVSTAGPAIFGVWLADQVGWRWSLASWAVVSAVAVIPWLVLIPHALRRRTAEKVALVDAPPRSSESGLWPSATAKILTVMFALSGFVAYSMFAVLPSILVETAGLSRDEAGFALFLWAMVGLPLSLVIPLLGVRPGWPPRLALVAAASGSVGFLGLMILPGSFTYLWVLLTGVATLTFSLVLTLIADRTDNHHTAAQLSGLINTVGYLIAASGPVLVGVLVHLTGSWLPGLVLLMLATLTNVVAYPVLRLHRSVDGELRLLSAQTSK